MWQIDLKINNDKTKIIIIINKKKKTNIRHHLDDVKGTDKIIYLGALILQTQEDARKKSEDQSQ